MSSGLLDRTAYLQAQRGMPFSVSAQFGLPGAPENPGTVTVSVQRLAGTTFTPAGAVTGTGTAAREVVLTAAETATLDTLRITWTGDASGTPTMTTLVDVVGDVLFTVPEAKLHDGGVLEDLDDAVLLEARGRIAQEFQQICGVAFGSRFDLLIVDGPRSGLDLLLTHGQSGAPVMLPTALRSVETRTAVGGDRGRRGASEQVAASEVLPWGGVVSASTWPVGRRLVRVGVEHGHLLVPLAIRRAALRLLRFQVLENDIPSRATSMNSEDGTFTLATAGMRGAVYGLPEVDSVLTRHYGLTNPGGCMSAADSRAVAFEDAVIAALQAREDLAGVQVAVGPLGDFTAKKESIQFLGCRTSEEWAALGNARRDEDLVLLGMLFVDIAGGGPNGAVVAARNRAWALRNIVAAELRLDPGLGGVVYGAGIVRSEERRGLNPDAARRSTIDFEIAARASLPRG